jgi:Domain of unknown function (DUF1929)
MNSSGAIRSVDFIFGSTDVRYLHYPALSVIPDGRIAFISGGRKNGFLNSSGTGSWQNFFRNSDASLWGDRERTAATRVMYLPGRFLVAGGTIPTVLGDLDNSRSTNTAVKFDMVLNATRISNYSNVSNMNQSRVYHNSTILADGKVVFIGGHSGGYPKTDYSQTVNENRYAVEIWNPATGNWTLGASAQRPRNYHSTSLLLPDGRVLVAGGGACGDCNLNQSDAEYYYPPYLFTSTGSFASRPSITMDNATPLSSLSPQYSGLVMRYNSYHRFTFSSSTSISKVSLIQLGSVTHSVDSGQRYIELPISAATAKSGGYDIVVRTPSNANYAPTGYHMLFAFDSSGFPSVAQIVKIR